MYKIALSKPQGAVKHHSPRVLVPFKPSSVTSPDSFTVCVPMFSSHGNKVLGRENEITHTWAPSQQRNNAHNNPGMGGVYSVDGDQTHNPCHRI